MKKLRLGFIFIAGLFFFSILLASSVRNIYLSSDGGKNRLGFMTEPIRMIAETPSLIKQFFAPGVFYVSNDSIEDGFSYYNGFEKGSMPKLLVGYKEEKFGQKFALYNINTGVLLKEWKPENRELYNRGYNELNPSRPDKGSDLYFMHPHLTKDSALIITSQLTSLLAKVDKNSQVEWVKNDKVYHHTIEADGNGNMYVCTRPFTSGNYEHLPGDWEVYKSRLLDDHITLLEEKTGVEKFSKSVIEILLENGYEELLLYKGQTISDPIHLNDIQPAISSSEYWQTGDLLISCRNISTVFLYRPSTNKILWLQHGPWYNQHDVDFYGDNQIVVFGNDVIREESRTDPRLTSSNLSFSPKRGNNEIYLYNFATDSVRTPYSDLMQKEHIRSITSGRCDILANGDIFIEDTNNGRIIVGDSVRKKIEYVKRLDKEHISSLFWSRIIN